MKIQKFEDIVAWQKAQEFAIEIYDNFKKVKDFEFRNQILRAVISISSNIAEGFDRSSDADFARFLYISLSSCSEVKSMLYLTQKLGYLSEEKKLDLLKKANDISKLIRGLIKYLTKKSYRHTTYDLRHTTFIYETRLLPNIRCF